MGCILCNIIFCVLTVSTYGYAVLALGISLSMVLNVLIQISFLKKYLSLPLSSFVNKSVAKLLAAAALCLYGTDQLASSIIDPSSSFWPFLGQFLMVGLGGAGLYGISLFVLQMPNVLHRSRQR